MILIYKSFERGRQFRLLSDFPEKKNQFIDKIFLLRHFWNKFVHRTLYNQSLHQIIIEISRNFDKNRNLLCNGTVREITRVDGTWRKYWENLAQVWSKWVGKDTLLNDTCTCFYFWNCQTAEDT